MVLTQKQAAAAAAGRARRRWRRPPKPVGRRSTPPKPVEPAKPTQYTMAINTQPTGAEVFNGAERLGITPCNVALARVGRRRSS